MLRSQKSTTAKSRTYRGAQGMLVGTLKFVYKSGEVRFVSEVAYNSRWGCHGYSSFKAYLLNVIITDRHYNVIFPLRQFIKHGSGLWYTMPVVDDKHSDELVFSDFDYQLYLHPYMELRVLFGEDLKNWSESGLQWAKKVLRHFVIFEYLRQISFG